jgi:hypothetical protein
MLTWFTRAAAARHPIRETVRVQFGDPANPGDARGEMKVRFDDQGEPIFEPEQSLIKLDYLNEKGEWQRVPDEDLAMFMADKVFMDRLYAAAVKPAAEVKEEDYEATPEEHIDSFESSTVEQIADSEAVFYMWWQSLKAEEKVEFFEGSYFFEDLAGVMADKFRKMTVKDIKAEDPSIYDVLLKMHNAKTQKNKDNAQTQEQRKIDRTKKMEERRQDEPAPAVAAE